MANIPVNVGGLFQGGRIIKADPNIGPVFLRYSQIMTTDTLQFQFTTSDPTALTFGVPRSMFCDNSDNANEVTVVVQSTQQTFKIPPNSSGFYIINAILGDIINVTSSNASVNPVEFIFYNYDQVPTVWYKFGTNQVTVAIPDGADVAEGATTDAPVTNPALPGTVVGILKGILSELGTGIVIATSKVQGLVANGLASTANPVITGGVDGSGDVRQISVDSSGRQNVQGSIANGAAIGSNNGLLISGSDGTNIRFIATDTDGVQKQDVTKWNGNPVLSGGVNGSVAIGGTSAANATDDGANPVKIGGIFLSTLPTLTNNQRGNVELEADGSQRTAIVGINSTGTNVSGGWIAPLLSGDSTRAVTRALGVTGFVLNNAGTRDNMVSPDRAATTGGSTPTGVLAVEETGRLYSHINSNTTTAIKSGKGFLHTVTINTKGASANTLTLYDNTAGSGTVIAVIDTTGATTTLEFDLAFTTGLTAVTATGTAADITITYR